MKPAIAPRVVATNIFVEITPVWRAVIITYLIAYRMFFPALSELGHAEVSFLIVPRLVFSWFHTFLLLLPFLLARWGVGWLHPLVLPAILFIAKAVLADPSHLVMPLSSPIVSFQVATTSKAASLALSDTDLAELRMWYSVLSCIYLGTYYLCFFRLRPLSVPKLHLNAPHRLRTICLVCIAACIIAAAYVIRTAGDLDAYIVAMRQGRTALHEGIGHLVTVAQFSLYIVLIWFAYEERPFRNPLWICSAVTVSLVTILTSGSRSSLIYPICILLCLWWKRKSRLVIGPAVAAGAVALVVFGLFGAIRRDYNNDTVDWSILELDRAADWLREGAEETAARADEEADLAAFSAATNSDLLWGRTYLGAVAFWVPRAIWSGKPRSADTYNMWIAFEGGSIVDMPTGQTWGLPVGAAVEAFWNFHIGGVLCVAVALAVLHRWLVRLIERYHEVPALWVLYLTVMVNFTGTSLTFVATIRIVLLLVVLCIMLGIISLRSRSSGRGSADGAAHLQFRRPAQSPSAPNQLED